jgi:biopolymer transport protein ExbD
MRRHAAAAPVPPPAGGVEERAMAYRSAAADGTVAEINITPLVDVMLVLLVIFMIASPVLAHRTSVDLPQKGPEQPVPPERIAVRLAADGTLLWNGVAIPEAALAAQLRIEAAKSPQPQVRIDADPAIPYGRVAQVFAATRTAGLDSVGVERVPD